MALVVIPAHSRIGCCRLASPPFGVSSSTDLFGAGTARLTNSRRKGAQSSVSPSNIVCCSTKATSLFSDPVTAKTLQDKFGCKGVRFADIDGMPATELRLNNGSSVRLMLPGAHITSYKAQMWHGGEEEVLHSSRSQSGNSISTTLRGGIELNFAQLKDPLSSILPSCSNCWKVDEVVCEPSEYAQMTVSNISHPEIGVGSAVKGCLEFKYVVTLCEDSLSAALLIHNTGSVPVDFTGSIVSHLGVSSAEGSFAVGLKGYRYRSLAKEKDRDFDLRRFFSQLWGSKDRDNEQGKSGEAMRGIASRQELEGGKWTMETEDYSQLYGGMDRLYTTPPEYFSVMDRGLRRSIVFERHGGFQEFCISNPGPESKFRDWNKFVCVAPTQSCQSVRLYEDKAWRAAVTLLNPGNGDME